MIKVLLSFLFLFFIYFQSCVDVSGNGKCENECKEWETCTSIENEYGEVTNKCIPDTGRCNAQSDCPYPQSCNLGNHWCQGKCAPPCELWERCDTDNKCVLLEENCNSDEDCKSEKSKCDTKTHECVFECTPECGYWQTCKEGNVCELNKDKNYCETNSDCKDGKVCAENHKCIYDNCDIECEEWQVCSKDGECVANNGRCDDNNDCPRDVNKSFSCDMQTHVCKKDPGICNPVCNEWQTCNEDNECVTSDGYCNKNDDCAVGEKCTYEHICVPVINDGCNSDSDCENWEICENNICKLKDGGCNLIEDCLGDSVCDFQTHRCESQCNVVCEYWEECSLQGNSCRLRDGYCNSESDCNNGNICNQATHKCVETCNDSSCEPWGECQNNADCGRGKRCNENHECVYEIPNGCEFENGDDQCAEWQKCSISNQCIPDEGYCDSNSDCTGRCNPETHKCEDVCLNECEYWQECKEGECKTDEDHCDDDAGCSGNTFCSFEHVCERKCNPDCKEYEYCKDGSCVILDGFCASNSDCEGGKRCNSDTHICEDTCAQGCDEWETCINYNGRNICVLAGGRCSDEDYGEFVYENYGCGDVNDNFYCDLQTHTCVEATGSCNEECEEWEYCSGATNTCEAINGKCNTRSDCNEGEVCNPQTHECVPDGTLTGCRNDEDCKEWEHCDPIENVCVLDVNACNNNGDCDDDRTCNLQTHECVKNERECFIECEDWEVCKDGKCVPNENNFNCNMDDYCGPYSLCSSKTHRCENISYACSQCDPWEVCLESGCSLIHGTCNTDSDCTYDKQCNTTTHVCEYKECFRERDCDYVSEDVSHSALCKKKDGETRGYCAADLLSDARTFHGYNKTDIRPLEHLGYVYGYITAIVKNPSTRSIGFYVQQNFINFYSDGIRGCGCTYDDNGNIITCNLNSDVNPKRCPLENYLYNTIYVVGNKADYDKLKDYKVGDELSASVRYVNYYGMTMAIGFKGRLVRTNMACDETSSHYPCTVDGVETYCSVCRDNQYCDLDDGVCRDIDKFEPMVYDVASRQIIKNKMNEAEGFESAIVNIVRDKPYTVIENASDSNNNKTTLKNAYDEEFYIDKELTSYNLDRGTGQCINNLCKKGNWIPCNKYCEHGFKLVQEDSNRNGVGDTCEETDDRDTDGIVDSEDNCINDYNPSQTDSDGDGRGDACDGDLDGDGWDNDDDNCPTVPNPEQAFKKPCDIPIPKHASFDGDGMGIVTRAMNGMWNAITGCTWSCDEGYKGDDCDECDTGYHEEDDECVKDNKSSNGLPYSCKQITCNLPNRGTCKVISGVARCVCDKGYILNENGECVSNENYNVKLNTFFQRRGFWGLDCEYDDDSDWDGIKDDEDNCPWTFNPEQGDTDHDNQGDRCDEDLDNDGFLNNEDNCVNVYNPILCKICECADEVESEYSCRNDSDCSDIEVNGRNSGDGKCHYYETTLRTLKGVLKYEHETPGSKTGCLSDADCPNGEHCVSLTNSEVESDVVGGVCSSGSKSDNASYIVSPMSPEDISRCHNENCSR